MSILGLLLFLSASGKSSTLPFFPWWPGGQWRARPRPAQSFTAHSPYTPVRTFFFAKPLIVSASDTLSLILVLIGLTSALFASLAGRIRADVKTASAYATITQVSLIYAEIGLHWYTLAAFHTAGHMCLRTYQFLRAPSALHDLHVRSVLGVAAHTRASFYSRWVPAATQLWLYRLAFEQGALLSLYEAFIIRPFLAPALDQPLRGSMRPAFDPRHDEANICYLQCCTRQINRASISSSSGGPL